MKMTTVEQVLATIEEQAEYGNGVTALELVDMTGIGLHYVTLALDALAREGKIHEGPGGWELKPEEDHEDSTEVG